MIRRVSVRKTEVLHW